MNRGHLKYFIVVVMSLFLCLILYVTYWYESPSFKNFKKIQIGMSIEEIETFLGSDVVINPTVPGVVRAINAEDEIAFIEKFKREGKSPPNFRGYATRIQPVVEGDYILMWVIKNTGEKIFVAFIEGKVSGMYYFNPNYL